MSEAGRAGRRLFRPTAFRYGLLAGSALFVACGAVAYWILSDLWPPKLNVEIVVLGRDLGRHGVSALTIRDADTPHLKQSCRDACDDLTYRIDSHGDNSYTVRLPDAKGECLASAGLGYIGVFGRQRVTIGGEARLQFSRAFALLKSEALTASEPEEWPCTPTD